jgi:hypothetical protein
LHATRHMQFYFTLVIIHGSSHPFW